MPQHGTHARVNHTKPIDEPKIVIDYRDVNGSYYQLENWGSYGKKIVHYQYKCNCPDKETFRKHMGPFAGVNNCPTKTFVHNIAFRTSFQIDLDNWVKSNQRRDKDMSEEKLVLRENTKVMVKPFGQFELTFRLNGYGDDLERNIQVLQELAKRVAATIENNPTFEEWLDLVMRPEIKHVLAGGYDI